MTEWISVEDILPEATAATMNKEACETNVILVVTRGDVEVGFYCHDMGLWFSQDGSITLERVTHWMPLPEPPKGED